MAKKNFRKGEWVFIPETGQAGIVYRDTDERDVTVLVATVEENTDGERLSSSGMPLVAILKVVLEAAIILSQLIPVIDGMLPTFIRWWKEIFGTKEEKAAVKAFKKAKQVERELRRFVA